MIPASVSVHFWKVRLNCIDNCLFVICDYEHILARFQFWNVLHKVSEEKIMCFVQPALVDLKKTLGELAALQIPFRGRKETINRIRQD